MVNVNNYGTIHQPSVHTGRANIVNRYEANARMNASIGYGLSHYDSYLPNIPPGYDMPPPKPWFGGGYGLNMNAGWQMGGFGMNNFGLGPPGMYGPPLYSCGNDSASNWGLGIGLGSALLLGFAKPIGNFFRGLFGKA
ncbi:hypothetical protein IJ541_10245 [bacterium]|nr:hypothetical protein [bacterium]